LILESGKLELWEHRELEKEGSPKLRKMEKISVVCRKGHVVEYPTLERN
jgi:hypothetical protein